MTGAGAGGEGKGGSAGGGGGVTGRDTSVTATWVPCGR
jgi:hypothetical protein